MLMTAETCYQSCEKGPVKEPVVFLREICAIERKSC